MSPSDPQTRPATLDQMQALFAEALIGFKDADALCALAQQGLAQQVWLGHPTLVQERLALYRGNGQAVTHAALQAQFPVVAQWVGDDFFEGLVRHYRHCRVSSSGDLAERGKDFAAFLKTFAPVQDNPQLACVPDLAQLEWAIHQAESAADTQPLSLVEFLTEHGQDLAEPTLKLAAGTQLITSPFSIQQLWQAHQSDTPQMSALDWSKAERVVVFRPQYRVFTALLNAAEFAFIAACQSGENLGKALEVAIDAVQESAAEATEAVDFQVSLVRLFDMGLLAKL